ncbi:MAG TPA: S-layer homology domain-containing protein [Thermoanaerobaculia bacterium]|jgi:hypothetical protein
MKRTNSVLLAVLIACATGVALAQDVPNKAGSGPALKAQPKKATQQGPNTYGTTYSSFYRMGANEFTGVQVPGFDTWNDTFYTDGTKLRRYGQVANGYFIGTPHLPSGAKLLRVYVEDCVNTSNSVYGWIYSCLSYGDGCSVLLAISTAPGCGYDTEDVSGSGYVVDNSPSGNYLVILLATTATDGSDSFAGVSVEYQLQVSPAPGSATFNDVPTSDFAFQYIEALAASGITGGCQVSPPLYCPDNFVTRRQMAIFIAKALGLHFN